MLVIMVMKNEIQHGSKSVKVTKSKQFGWNYEDKCWAVGCCYWRCCGWIWLVFEAGQAALQLMQSRAWYRQWNCITIDAKPCMISPVQLHYNWCKIWILIYAAQFGWNITTTNDEPLAFTEDVVDGFGSLLKQVKLHDDVAQLCMISPERLHYNWKELEVWFMPRSLDGILRRQMMSHWLLLKM